MNDGLGAVRQTTSRTDSCVVGLDLLDPCCSVMILMKLYFTDAHYKKNVHISVAMCRSLLRKALICVDSTAHLKL